VNTRDWITKYPKPFPRTMVIEDVDVPKGWTLWVKLDGNHELKRYLANGDYQSISLAEFKLLSDGGKKAWLEACEKRASLNGGWMPEAEISLSNVQYPEVKVESAQEGSKKKRKRAEVCSSMKVAYETLDSALFFIRAERATFGDSKRAYQCPECGKWHLAVRKRK